MEAHGFEFIAESSDGGSGEFVGGLLGDAERVADFAVALSVANACGDLAETRREVGHRLFEAFPGFKSSGAISHRTVTSGNLLNAGFRSGGGLGNWKVEIVNVVPMVPDLPFVEIAQGIAHGVGGIGGEVAFGWSETPRGVGQCFLGSQLDFGMRQAGDVGELACDFGSEGKEFIHPFFHDGEKLSGYTHARQAPGKASRSVLARWRTTRI